MFVVFLFLDYIFFGNNFFSIFEAYEGLALYNVYQVVVISV